MHWLSDLLGFLVLVFWLCKLHQLYCRGHVQYVELINERGFYELLTKPKSDSAKRCRKQVFSEVLPLIRKYGYLYKLFEYPNRR